MLRGLRRVEGCTLLEQFAVQVERFFKTSNSKHLEHCSIVCIAEYDFSDFVLLLSTVSIVCLPVVSISYSFIFIYTISSTSCPFAHTTMQ